MHHFDYRDGELHCEDVRLAEIAERVGTPTYVYSLATLERHFRVFDGAFASEKRLVCYAMKASSNLALLRAMASWGAGFDIVSGGELHRALLAGADPRRIVFSGVGKKRDEIEAALRAGILSFNVESMGELEAIADVARGLGRRAPISLRVNPDVDAETHPYIATGLKQNKFGIPIREAMDGYRAAAKDPHLEVVGVDCHIGSQLVRTGPFADAVARVAELVLDLAREGIRLHHVDLGGGLGIPYRDEDPPSPDAYAQAIRKALAPLAEMDLTLLFEPGRVIVGNAGILLTRVLYTKRGEAKEFVIVDAAMNDLLRPSLYDAWHAIQPVARAAGRETIVADVVGPVCETGDFLAKDRPLEAPRPGELLAVMSAGAYGFSMASNYNSRPRAAEVVVKGGEWAVARRRETLDDLVRGEEIPPFVK